MAETLTPAVAAPPAAAALPTTWRRRLALALTGLLCGLVAALAMVLLMLAGRTWLGISPPFE
ncbi:MAG: hypothetical protein QM692_05730, partial [Thermomicrobiales bacterium]